MASLAGLFTESPIEAAIWTSFVGMQQWIVDNIVLTPWFKSAVLLWLGIALVRAISSLGFSRNFFGHFLGMLLISSLGFFILKTKSSGSFGPQNARGSSWTASAKVKEGAQFASLRSQVYGLAVYNQIHGAANYIAQYISKKASELFKNQAGGESPYLLIQTLSQTASKSLDDPASQKSLAWMFENCSSRAPVLGATASYSALFDLSSQACSSRYKTLRAELSSWAKNNAGTSIWNQGELAVDRLRSHFGNIDKETLENKLIASSLVNAARRELGRESKTNVSGEALLSRPGESPLLGSATTYFASLAQLTSLGGAASSLLGPLTGVDFFGADARNQSAVLYNRIVQFLPPIRGYAKGILALSFVFAAASLCFGSLRFVISWLGMLLVFSLYDPLSTILYESVMMFSSAKDTTMALQALKNDPLILSGAAIIDDNLARLQAIYFALQMGLAAVCGAGGISIFMFAGKVGGGLSSTLLHQALHVSRFLPSNRNSQ